MKPDLNKLEIVFEYPFMFGTPPNVKVYTQNEYVKKLLEELIDESGSFGRLK
jgi:hypothetical protein